MPAKRSSSLSLSVASAVVRMTSSSSVVSVIVVIVAVVFFVISRSKGAGTGACWGSLFFLFSFLFWGRSHFSFLATDGDQYVRASGPAVVNTKTDCHRNDSSVSMSDDDDAALR